MVSIPARTETCLFVLPELLLHQIPSWDKLKLGSQSTACGQASRCFMAVCEIFCEWVQACRYTPPTCTCLILRKEDIGSSALPKWTPKY